jgi:hypothetical protein
MDENKIALLDEKSEIRTSNSRSVTAKVRLKKTDLLDTGNKCLSPKCQC